MERETKYGIICISISMFLAVGIIWYGDNGYLLFETNKVEHVIVEEIEFRIVNGMNHTRYIVNSTICDRFEDIWNWGAYGWPLNPDYSEVKIGDKFTFYWRYQNTSSFFSYELLKLDRGWTHLKLFP